MSESGAPSVRGIRPIKKTGVLTGKWEMALAHQSLPRRITRNFNSWEEAATYKLRRLEELDAGLVRPELTACWRRPKTDHQTRVVPTEN